MVGGLALLFILPVIFTGVQSNWPGERYLVPGIMLSLILTGLGFAAAFPKQRPTTRPGWPAPFGNPPYGLRGSTVHERLRSLAPEAQGVHRALLWTPVALVACAGVLVLGAIVAGPRGVEGVGSGLGIMVGGLFLLAGYGVASYRSLLPTAGAILLWGVLIEAQAVADAWSLARTWSAWDLLLIVPVVPVQALSAEAAWRAKPGWFWAGWTAVGTAMAVAYPLWLFFGRPGGGELAVGLTLGSLVWGVAANFAFAPIPKFARWAGVTVFGGWAFSLVLAYAYPVDLTLRLKAAGIVAAAVVVTVAFVSYFLARPRPETDTPVQEPA